MKIKFTKMQGLGNDFVVIDAINQQVNFTPKQICALADRHFGIGCDQLLMLLPSRQADADFGFKLFNADGSEAEQSGNGMRCLAKFAFANSLTSKKSLVLHANSGRKVKLLIQDDGLIVVDMGKAVFEPRLIPMVATELALSYNLQLENQTFVFGAVNLGNPHVVIKVADVNTVDVGYFGKLIATHENFPEGVNVGFMQVINREKILLRVYERGSGETLACGSGSCAAVIIGRLWQLLDEDVYVQLTGGNLTVSCPDVADSIILKGPAVKVFTGEFDIL